MKEGERRLTSTGLKGRKLGHLAKETARYLPSMHIALLINKISNLFRMPVIAWSPNATRESKNQKLGWPKHNKR